MPRFGDPVQNDGLNRMMSSSQRDVETGRGGQLTGLQTGESCKRYRAAELSQLGERRSGVRPLYDDGASAAQAATRDYVLKLDVRAGEAPLISIFGGKITTYRRLAESALAMLAPYLSPPRREGGWTAREPLPGGDFPMQSFEALSDRTRRSYPFLPEGTI